MNKYPISKLGDVTTLITDGKHGDSRDEPKSGFFFLSSKDLRDGRLHYDQPREINHDDFLETHRRTNLRPGDILLANCGASIGRVGIAQKDERICRTTFQKSISVIKSNRKLVRNEYLYFFCLANCKHFVDLGGGTAQPNLLIGDLKRISIPLPPLIVQDKIAGILTTYDGLIENNKQRIALLEKLAEEIYREWFVRLRFPGHKMVRVIKGVPQDWALVKLEDAFKFSGGGTPTKNVDRYWNDGDINWFTPSDITDADGIFLDRSDNQCTEEGYNASSARMFPAYSVMLTSRATIGAIGINTTPACTNQGFITCIPNDQYPLPYLYHWLKLAKPHFELLAGGATFAELTKGTFKRIEILTPPESIMTQFVNIESPLFKNIETLLSANRQLIETRNLLLPRLISGKLSVENLNIQFPPSMTEELNAESPTTAHA